VDLGILVWTTLIAGSAIVLFLALPDLFAGFVGLFERLRGTDRHGFEGVAPPASVTVTRSRPGQRHQR